MAYLTTPYRNIALKATKQVVKTMPATVRGWHVFNQDAAVTYLQLYDALTADVTVGTTTPTYTFAVPTSGWLDSWVAGDDKALLVFQTGLVIAATTTISGSTAPTTGLLVNFSYE